MDSHSPFHSEGEAVQIDIKVLNDKEVDLSKTIKNAKKKSRAEIQLIKKLVKGDGSEECTVRISGDKGQIDIATASITEAMDQVLPLEVTDSNISWDRVRVPKAFVDQNHKRLNKKNGSVVLMNERGTACDASLSWAPNGCFILSGWTKFCTSNKLQNGDICKFKLLQKGEKPAFQLCTRSRKKEEELSSRFAKITPTLYSLEAGKQNLPERFTKVNRVEPGEIIFVDKNGDTYTMKLKRRKEGRYLYIKDRITWKKFCLANQVSAEEPFILELTEKRELKFFLKVRMNEKEPSLVQQVLTSERHATSEFCSRSQGSACPEEEPEHSGQLVLQTTPPPQPREMNHFDKDLVEEVCDSLRMIKKRPSSKFEALRMNKRSKEANIITSCLQKKNIITSLVHEGFVESSAGVAALVPSLVNNATAPGQSATRSVPLVYNDPFPYKLEMLQRQSDIRKKWAEAKSLLRAEFKRRRAEVDEEFKRKLDDVEAEYTAKNSEHTSPSRLFSNLQLEIEKSQKQSEIEKKYEEEDSLLTAEIKRRRAEVDEEFERKLVQCLSQE